MPLPNRHGVPQNNGMNNQPMRAPQRPQPQNYPPQRPPMQNAPQQYNPAPVQQPAPQQDMSFDFNDDNGFNFDNSDDNAYAQPQQMESEPDYANRRQQELQPDARNPFAAPMRPTPSNAGMPPIPNRQQLPNMQPAAFNAPQENNDEDISFNDAMNGSNAGKPAANFNNPDEIEDDNTSAPKKVSNPFAAFGKKKDANADDGKNQHANKKAKSFNLFPSNSNANGNDADDDYEAPVNHAVSGGSSDYGAISIAFGTSVLSIFGLVLAVILGIMLNNWSLIQTVAIAFLIGLPVIGLIFGVLAFVDKNSSKIAAIVGIIASVLALGIGGFAYVKAPDLKTQLSNQITEKVMGAMGGLFGGSSSSSSSDSSATNGSTTSSSDSDSTTDSSSNSDDGSYCKVTVNGVTKDCNDGSTVVNNDGSSYESTDDDSGSTSDATDDSSSSSDTTASN